MKHKVSTIAAIGLLALACTTTAFAEESAPVNDTPMESAVITEQIPPSYYPYTISLQEDGEQVLVVKEYRVPAGTTVNELREDTISRMGRDYQLWGVSEVQDAYTIEEVTLQKTCEVAVQSNIPEEAASQLQSSITYDDNGFAGTLQLISVTCGDEMQEDGTYKGSALYSGPVSRTIEGDIQFTLIYAPVPVFESEVEDVPMPTHQNIPAPAIVGLAALLILFGFLIVKLFSINKDKASADSAEEEKPKVYVPSEDVVLGAGKDEEPANA